MRGTVRQAWWAPLLTGATPLQWAPLVPLIHSERAWSQPPAACGKQVAEGTAMQAHRCLHPAGGEHSVSAGAQPKMKMSLDLHQGVTGLPAREPQIRCFSQTPEAQALVRFASCMSPGSKAGLVACWGGPSPYTLLSSHKSTIKPNGGAVKMILRFLLLDVDMRELIAALSSPRRRSLYQRPF